MPEEIAASIGRFGIWYVVFLFALTLHEAAHAFVAWLGGDETAYQGGQVTLNPMPHIRREIFGTVIIPVVTFFFSGWMMGWASTPYDPEWGERYPKRQGIMSAAGPVANLLQAAAAFAILKVLLLRGYFVIPALDRIGFERLVVPPSGAAASSLAEPLALALSVALNLNVLLFLFNLIPLPPLDGAGMLKGLAPGAAGRFYATFLSSPGMSIIGLLIAWQVFGYVFQPAFTILVNLLYWGIPFH
ncbi:MAG TPA: site-2 protease family protein [Candidatus Saccharimonadales bacterium]|nr:site-2 protease family protein [Candidatus Saccharimonadales bacterium]